MKKLEPRETNILRVVLILMYESFGRPGTNLHFYRSALTPYALSEVLNTAPVEAWQPSALDLLLNVIFKCEQLGE